MASNETSVQIAEEYPIEEARVRPIEVVPTL